MKIAIVYDRVNKWGGAERVLLCLHKTFPEATLFTSVYNPQTAPWAKVFPAVKTSFLQKFPLIKTKHEYLGTFMPLAFESLDLTGFDLVISVTSEAAKGIITRPDTFHICYCLTPTRYLWSAYELYFKNPFLKFFSQPAVNYLRRWDKIAAQRPDLMIAISSEVQKRIKRYYQRDSFLIYPSAGFNRENKPEQKKDFYLVVNRLVPYKKTDLAVKVFNTLGQTLYIVGTGSEESKLKRIAKKNIKFLGEVSESKLVDYYRKAKALIFPQEEDFGIAAVEAQSLGTPVIAYKAGGSLDTVIEGETGIFFKEQTEESLISAIKRFQNLKFEKEKLRKNAERFSEKVFKRQFLSIINNYINKN